MNENFKKLEQDLLLLAKKSEYDSARFFKQEPGSYAQHDLFLGIKVPDLRILVKKFKNVSYEDILLLLNSRYNEYRLLGLFFLVDYYQNGDVATKQKIYHFYIQHIKAVNNWNLVDSSAHLIIGAHLYHQLEHENLLFDFADSDDLWLKRIAIIATWYHIRQNQFELTLKISEKLLCDKHDLIHKAVGWMLREVGKKDKNILLHFLDENAEKLPRTALRYAIEHFDAAMRMKYLNIKKL